MSRLRGTEPASIGIKEVWGLEGVHTRALAAAKAPCVGAHVDAGQAAAGPPLSGERRRRERSRSRLGKTNSFRRNVRKFRMQRPVAASVAIALAGAAAMALVYAVAIATPADVW